LPASSGSFSGVGVTSGLRSRPILLYLSYQGGATKTLFPDEG
jgi:hypothetical protein